MKRVCLILAVLLALPAGAWMVAGEIPFESSSYRAPASAPSVDKTFESSGITFAPAQGQRYTYQFQRKILIKGLGGDLAPIEYKGELFLDILDSSPNGFTALAGENIRGIAANRVRLKIRSDGRGEAVDIFSKNWDTEEDRQHENVLKDLLAQLFFPLRQDTVGFFEARVEGLPPAGDFLQFRKTKLAYRPGLNTPKILSSLHQVKWSRERNMPEELRGKESTELGEKPQSIQTQASYLIKLKSVSAAPKTDKALLAELQQNGSLALNVQAGGRGGHPDYENLTWQDVLSRMAKIQSLSNNEQLKVFGDLVKLLELKKVSPEALLSLLREENALKLGADSPLFQTVIGALATAGGEEALSALREIYQDPDCPISGKGSVLSSLTTTQAPLDADTRSFLADLMEQERNKDLSQGAGFAYGASLERLTDISQIKAAEAKVTEAWARAQSAGSMDQLALLDLIGNSGRSEFLPVVRSALNSQNPDVQAKAVFTLRFMHSAEARELLGASLGNNDSRIRTAAAAAIGMAIWHESFRKPLDACVAQESVAAIRSACERAMETGRTLAKAN